MRPTRSLAVRFGCWAAMLFAALGGSVARADSAVPSVTNTLVGEYRVDNRNGNGTDDDYGVLINKLNVSATSGPITGSARLDGTAFYGRPVIPRRRPYKDDLQLERLLFSWQGDSASLQAGDIYLQLGRGIALSLRKEDEIGVDIAVRGGNLRYRLGRVEAELFGGMVNPVNVDPVSQRYVRDPGDALGGTRLSVDAGFARFGAYGLYVEPQDRVLDEITRSQTGGVTVDVADLFEVASLYLEADGQLRDLGGSRNRGLAAYGTLDLTFGDTLLLIEGLYLDDWQQRGSRNTAVGSRFIYNRPPTLARIEEEILNNRDVAGARLRVEQYIEAIELVLFVNGAYRLENPGEANAVQQLHGYGGGELTFGDGRSRFELEGGYRDERLESGRFKTLAHGSVDYVQSLSGPWSSHLTVDAEFRTLEARAYERGSAFAGVERAGLGSVTAELGWDTQDPRAGVRNLFLAAIVAWHPNADWRIAVTGGTQRGGIKCVAGVCRNYPAFAGGRVEVVSRF